jgi:hypothetical protein
MLVFGNRLFSKKDFKLKGFDEILKQAAILNRISEINTVRHRPGPE